MLDWGQDHEPRFFGPAPCALKPRLQRRKWPCASADLGRLITVQGSTYPAASAFYPQARAEPDKISNGADVLRGHSTALRGAERFGNKLSVVMDASWLPHAQGYRPFPPTALLTGLLSREH